MTERAEMSMRNGEDLLPLVQGFSVHRAGTIEILDRLSEEQLGLQWPRPGLNTFSKQFQEMAAVERAFADALTSGVMDFSTVPDVFAFEQASNKARLHKALREADRYLERKLRGSVRCAVRWDDLDLLPEAHITNLIAHEVFHHGQMTMALYALGLGIPDGFRVNWALPANP